MNPEIKTESTGQQPGNAVRCSYWVGPIWSELLVALLPLFFFLSIYKWLPNELAIHFNETGIPDGYAHKDSSFLWFSLLFPCCLMPFLKAMRCLCLFLLSRSGKTADQKNNLKIASKVMTYMEFTIIAVASAIIIFVLVMALSPSSFAMDTVMLDKIIFVFVNLLVILTGNLCPKVRPNKYFGIRTPYAFSSEEAWNQTQRFGGKLLVGAGILNLCVTLAPFSLSLLFLTGFNLSTLMLTCLILSFWKPRKNNEKTAGQS